MVPSIVVFHDDIGVFISILTGFPLIKRLTFSCLMNENGNFVALLKKNTLTSSTNMGRIKSGGSSNQTFG
jgi:hypothetical protein